MAYWLVWNETEFVKPGGRAIFGGCGVNAVAMAVCRAKQKYDGFPAVGRTATDVAYLRMRPAGQCDSNGITVGSQLEAYARGQGLKTWRQSSGYKWQAFVDARLAEGAAVIWETHAGHVLKDDITGQGEDAGPGLANHYILLTAKVAGGYMASDGDNNTMNPVVGGARERVYGSHQQVRYLDATLAASLPIDLIAVYPSVAPAGAPPVEQLPGGWHDDGVTLTAPNGVVVVKGFRGYVLMRLRAGTWVAGNPYAVEWANGADESYQLFASTMLVWKRGVGITEATRDEVLAHFEHVREGKAA